MSKYSVLENKLNSLFCDIRNGHDYYHLDRTRNIALKIQGKEGGNRDVIEIAALLHDLHRYIEKIEGKYCEPKNSLSLAAQLLKESNINDYYFDHICECIEKHEDYNFTIEGKRNASLETLIIQNADNIDALGAIGIARAFSYGGYTNEPLYNPNISLCNNNYYITDIQESSTIHHFYNKLLKLECNMNTNSGKMIAETRIRYMENFLEKFKLEWEN